MVKSSQIPAVTADKDQTVVTSFDLSSLSDFRPLNAIDPEAYFRDILARIADHKINRIAELLPWNWQTQQNVATMAA